MTGASLNRPTVENASQSHVFLSPPPIFGTAARHVELLTGAADTPMWFRLIHSADRTPKGLAKVVTPHPYGPLAEVWPRIVDAQAAGYAVYVIPNAGGNSDREITTIRTLFADKDGGKHRDHWFKEYGDERGAATHWEDVRWHARPDFIVFRGDDTGREAIRRANELSSVLDHADNLKAGGLLAEDVFWHAYWRLDDCPVSDFKAAQQRLAAHYGSDPSVCNPARVMRLAGTLHTKGEPRYVNLMWWDK